MRGFYCRSNHFFLNGESSFVSPGGHHGNSRSRNITQRLKRLLRVRFDRRQGSQPTVAMRSVAEAESAEFAETAATLAPQIGRFFWWGEWGGGPRILAFPSHLPPQPPPPPVPPTFAL